MIRVVADTNVYVSAIVFEGFSRALLGGDLLDPDGEIFWAKPSEPKRLSAMPGTDRRLAIHPWRTD